MEETFIHKGRQIARDEDGYWQPYRLSGRPTRRRFAKRYEAIDFVGGADILTVPPVMLYYELRERHSRRSAFAITITVFLAFSLLVGTLFALVLGWALSITITVLLAILAIFSLVSILFVLVLGL